MNFKSEFLHILSERGFLHQCTDLENLDQLMHKESIGAYIGFDPTAPSLHVGSLIPIVLLKWLKKCGHRPVILMGGGTACVGDPSGKDVSRQLLSEEIIECNIKSISTIFEKILDANVSTLMLNNNMWLKNINYIDFLRTYGIHFSINRMISLDTVKSRLDRESFLSFLEFNYMILQAYDFLTLSRTHDVRLQMGGADQWGNIINGVDLVRRMDQKQIFGLTSPLLTTSNGLKMGKTSQGALWLNEDLCSSYDFWQFWRNTHDGDVGRFLRLFTELPLQEIHRLEQLQGAEINEAKKILACEITKLCHSEKSAFQAQTIAETTFEHGLLDENLPSYSFADHEKKGSLSLIDVLCITQLASSKAQAKRLLQEGAVRCNDQKILDNIPEVIPHVSFSFPMKLSVGKKKHIFIKE